ncbi:MAG: DUF4920 domain-containing protein [Gemmatimonadales bacterium]|nr:DUF4920 domain-containing protein [Gemmatimonadales bacterium]
MRVHLLVSGIFLSALACTANRSADQGGTMYGETITLADTTRISEILSHPGDHVGQRVLVTGMVVDVCSKRGCWLELASDREYETLRVKVDDGVIVFPMTARGHRAVVEGVVEELELTEEQVRERAQHHAEEQGLEFDPSTVTGPETTYQLRGIGAAIFE